ncbi:hypothetical protein AAE478_009607 [Parahypoxylon ruwenzoriense]
MPKSAKDILVDCATVAIGVPLVVCCFGIVKTLEVVYEVGGSALHFYHRCRIKTRRLRKSKPLGVTPPKSHTAARSLTGRGASFLHLPPEIRLHIYLLALKAPAIVQVNGSYPFWGSRPDKWAPAQGIRGDGDQPSWALRAIIGLGGSGLNQVVSPPRHGCVHYGAVSQLICGEGYHSAPGWAKPESTVFYTDLMRSCRIVYGEVLDVLYADNTISLFGLEMVHYFSRNASPEGLLRVRFAHVALVISSASWNSSSQRKEVQETVRTLRSSLVNLRQLDFEVALTWGQPEDPQRFWVWMREEVLGQLWGLETFVLKVSVYRPLRKPQYGGQEAWAPGYELLSSWDDGEYQVLKARVTSSDKVALS